MGEQQTVPISAAEEAESVFVAKFRETRRLGDGSAHQVFDIVNCPGLSLMVSGVIVGDHGFERESEVYELSNGNRFDNAADALLAWNDQQPDLRALDALGHVLLRYTRGLQRPLWEDRLPADKALWIAHARSFRHLMRNIGLDVIKLDLSQ